MANSAAKADDLLICIKAAGKTAASACDRAIRTSNIALAHASGDASEHGRRGDAFAAKGNFVAAISDYDQSIALAPTDPRFYLARGRARSRQFDFDGAMRDFSTAIRLDPKNVAAHLSLGIANIYAGSLADAQSEFEHANRLDPTYPYPALWLDIAKKRAHRTDNLDAAIAGLDLTKWPGQIVRLYKGELSEADVWSAAKNADRNTQMVQFCEADFFIGERRLHGGQFGAARRLFERAAADDCPKSFSAWSGARAELAVAKPRAVNP